METKNILIIANQLIDILEHIHDCGYAHSDIKAENIMIGKGTYKKNKSDENGKLGNATSQQTAKGCDKRKPARRLRLTLISNDSNNRQAKRTAKSKSYAESSSGMSSNKSEDSDFAEDFDKLSDDDDDDDEDDDDDDEDENENDEDIEDEEGDNADNLSNLGNYFVANTIKIIIPLSNFNFTANFNHYLNQAILVEIRMLIPFDYN